MTSHAVVSLNHSMPNSYKILEALLYFVQQITNINSGELFSDHVYKETNKTWFINIDIL